MPREYLRQSEKGGKKTTFWEKQINGVIVRVETDADIVGYSDALHYHARPAASWVNELSRYVVGKTCIVMT